jgi:hypothetical protein
MQRLSRKRNNFKVAQQLKMSSMRKQGSHVDRYYMRLLKLVPSEGCETDMSDRPACVGMTF